MTNAIIEEALKDQEIIETLIERLGFAGGFRPHKGNITKEKIESLT